MEKEFIIIITAFSVSTFSILIFLLASYMNRERTRMKEMESVQRRMIENQRNEYEKLQEVVYSNISDIRKRLEDKMYSNAMSFTRDGDLFLDTNHVLFDDKGNNDMIVHSELPDFSFFEGMAIDLRKVKVDDKMVMCLMPFNSKFDNLKQTISETCYKLGYNFRRSDDGPIENPNDLKKSIIQMILRAKVIVAVLDGRNPNVYYEIGIAHSVGKLVLMAVYMKGGTLSPDAVAFDLSHNNLIIYKNLQDLEEQLTKALEAVRYDKDL